jgi:penicillin-binding protein 1A
LKQFPAAGKTGTAYDFTDAIFAGYDSALTCAVWAGFDKPQKIYRGAFGRDIALPVWVDVMNASVDRYRPRELPKPASLHDVEICSRSGLLATDKCYDTVKTDTGTVQRRTTYRELATDAQMPTEPCNVHGEVRTRLVGDLPPTSAPRASLAVDTSQVSPITVKGPIVLADKDPYNAVKSTVKPPPVPEKEKPEPEELATATTPKPATTATETETLPDPTKPVLRAQPVEPVATATPATVLRGEPLEVPVRRAQAVRTPPPRLEPTPVEIRRAQPVRPADEIPASGILRVPTPSPADIEDE